MYHQKVIFLVYRRNLEVLDREAFLTHVTCHLSSRYNALRCGRSDGSWCAMSVLLTVRLRSTSESMALYNTLKSATLRQTADLYHITLGKLCNVDDVANLELSSFNPEFLQCLEVAQILKVSCERLVRLLVGFIKSNLNSFIAISLSSANLRYCYRTSLQYRYRDLLVAVPNLSHFYFFTEYEFHMFLKLN